MKTITKFIGSFFKSDWKLKDYPIRYRKQNVEEYPWMAQIINWWVISGLGKTQQEALEDLRCKFNLYKENNEKLPRPGTKVPLKYASTEQVDRYKDIAKDFLEKTLKLNYDECFLSDQSSLWDFYTEMPEEVKKVIYEVYGVDISDIKDGSLVEIFRRIKNRYSK